MSRKNREIGKSGIYHIIIRGNNKQNIFYDDYDRFLMLKKIKQYSHELGIEIYAYCLMSNHVHILIGNANPKMSKFMLKLNTSYSKLFNMKYERIGHLFQGRYLSKPIENDDSFKIVLRYILHNPEKTGLAKYNEYSWNSYLDVLKKQYQKPSIITDYFRKKIFDIFEGKKRFMDFIKSKKNDICMDYEGKLVINDFKCIYLLKSLFNIKNPYKLQNLQKEHLCTIFYTLKKLGASENQLSRISGLSRREIRYILNLSTPKPNSA